MNTDEKNRRRFIFHFLFVSLLTLSLSLSSTLAQGGIQVLFDLDDPAGGPFPSNLFTVLDPGHNTGLRVNLPKPDCTVRVTDCQNIDVINTLDGFNLQPRLSIPFTGPIDVNSVTSETVFLLRLGSTLPDGNPGGQIVGINQIVWDPITNTLEELLAFIAQVLPAIRAPPPRRSRSSK